MTRQNAIQTQQPAASASPLSKGGILQRKCDSCGQHTIAGGECADCGKKKIGLQRKLTIGASNDPLELEADRVADRVMASSANSVVSSAPPRIQRFTGQTTGQADMTAPASVDSVLSSSGSPLEPGLQQDMGQRFGHDFSRVKVHTGDEAARSARDVNANAYTVGQNIVFGAGKFTPKTKEGRRLIAHELTHVLQQSVSDRITHVSNQILHRQEAPRRQKSTTKEKLKINLSQLATLPHLALKSWRTLTQSERDQVQRQMIASYGPPFVSEFLNYANGVKKSKPGLAGTLKGSEYTPKWLFDRGYRHAYGEIWVRPSGEYLIVLQPAQTKSEGNKDNSENSKDKPDNTSQSATDGGKEKSEEKPEETYQYGGVTYYKSGKIASYPKSMESRCMLDCLNSTKNEEDCSDCCVEKISASDAGCLNFCISSCEDYYKE